MRGDWREALSESEFAEFVNDYNSISSINR